MKKVVALVLSLTIAMTFFAFDVFAAPVDPVSQNYHYGERNFNNGMTISISTREMYPAVDGTVDPATTSNTSSYNIIAVIRFMNTSDRNMIVSNVEFTMAFNSLGTSVVQGDHLYGPIDIRNFSSDMQMTFNSYYNSGNFTVTPSEEWAYNGNFIVPAHDCLRAVAVITMPAVYYSSNSTWAYATVYGLSVSQDIGVSDTTVNPASLAGVISALDYGNYRLNAINNTVSSLLNYVDGLEGLITYTNSAIDYSNYRVNIIMDTLDDVYDYMIDSQTGLPHIVYDLDHIWTHVANIEDLIKGSSSDNTALNNQSSAIASQSDSIHQQETTWYQQNSQAMQSVGLSNYQYSQQQYNGILGVTFQFEQLWNALGSWNLIYIFTLMLSLATFIIRHRPTTKMQQRASENEFWTNTNRSYRMLKDTDYRNFVQWRAKNR